MSAMAATTTTNIKDPAVDTRRAGLEAKISSRRVEKKNRDGRLNAEEGEHEISHKWETVKRWLLDVYAARGQNVPPYEANPGTLQLLHDLAVRWTRRVAVERALHDVRRQEERRYCNEADRIEKVLRNLKISVHDSLSREAQSAIESLSASAVALGVNEPTSANFESAIERQTVDLDQFIREERRYLSLTEELSKSMAEVDEAKQAMTSLCEEARMNMNDDRQKLAMWRRNIERLNAKQSDYEERVATLQGWQRSSGLDTGEFRLSDVLQLEKSFNFLGCELQTKETALQAYLDIPPDLTLARLKLEEIREKLNKLRSTRDSLLFGVAKHVL